MKKIVYYLSAIVAGVVTLVSCTKEAGTVAEFTTTENNAYLRVIHVSPGFRSSFNLPDSFNVYVGGKKANASFFTYGSIFPGAATGNGYFAIGAGFQTIKLSVNGFATGAPDSTKILDLAKVVTAGQSYTLLVSDYLKTNADASILTDVLSKPTSGNIALRFIHVVQNDTAGKNVDVFSYARNATIFSNYAPGTIAANFSNFGYNSAVPDTLYVTRPAPAGTPLANRIVLTKTAFAPLNQRNYSLIFRGDANLTTGTKARTLSAYIH